MSHPSKADPARLSQIAVSWHVTIRKLLKWMSEPGEMATRPYAIMITIPESKSILKTKIISEPPDPHKIFQWIVETILAPESSVHQPHRPECVVFDDRLLTDHLTDPLAGIGIRSEFQSLPTAADEAIALFEELIEEAAPDFPGLLSIPGSSPEKIKQLFLDSANFFHSHPWTYLSDHQPIAIHISPPGRQGYIQLMGQAGVQISLNLYWDWDDLLNTYSKKGDPFEQVPPGGIHSLSFESSNMIPADDLDAIEKYGWQIAAPNAYPLPCIYSLDDVDRPSISELAIFQALLQAIPHLVGKLDEDREGDYFPVEIMLQVDTFEGLITVKLQYPAGEIPSELNDDDESLEPYDEFEQEQKIDEQDLFDFRALEAEMASHSNEFGKDLETSLRDAQLLIYQAWNTQDQLQRRLLAHQALEISPDCADAYVLLAEEEAQTIEEANENYRLGLQAAERALGSQYVQKYRGLFWEKLETRPLMRAIEGLANTLAEMDRPEDSLQYYRQLISFNTDDHLGVRYPYLHALMGLQMYSEAHQLIHAFSNEISAFWSYTHALISFINIGATPKADNALRWALQQNPYVPAYLTGEKKLPNELPGSFRVGDEDEAVYYALDYYSFWWQIPGAVNWLKVIYTPNQ